MIRNTLFFIKEAFLSTKKNGIMSLATVISLTAALIIVGMFLLLSININNFLSNTESQFVAVAYLKDGLSDEQVNKLVQDTKDLQGVKQVKYVSEEEAFEKLKEDLSEHEEVLAGIIENPLPSSIEIMVTESMFLEDIAFELNQYNEIEEVNYGGQLTKNMMLVFDFVRKTGIAIISILIFIAILIMVSVIKISVHSRHEEIEIMALVGATSWFIRWPFIIEGFLKGIFSSILAVLILAEGYLYYTEKIKEYLPFLSISSNQTTLIRVMIIIILLGVLIGVLGSMISLRKIRFEEI